MQQGANMYVRGELRLLGSSLADFTGIYLYSSGSVVEIQAARHPPSPSPLPPQLGLRPQYSLPSSSVLDCGLTLTRTVLEAAHRCPRSTTNPVRQIVVTALRRRTCEVRAILHAGKQSHSQGGVWFRLKRGVFHTGLTV